MAARRAWVTVVLQGLSFSNCVALLTLDFDTPVVWAIHYNDFLGACSSLASMSSNFSSVSTPSLHFRFLSLESPVVLSLFTKLWIVCLLGTSQNLCRNFRQHFKQICISYRCHAEIHITLKYTAPSCNTLFTNCNREQMANGADNCCPLLTNHKQIPMHEPRHSQ
jgi:hypothetical protein